MVTDEPLVSVIMNCYNCEKYLKESIESVINQTYKNWEIIFWDNQSTDNSAQIVKSHNDNRIKYFYAPEFTPLGKARNLAIEKTNGKWIAFLDCDDLWDKEKLKLSFLELEKNKNKFNISLIYSRSIVIDENNIEIRRDSKSPSGKIYDKLLIEGDFIVFSSIIVRKDILNKNGNIAENLNYCEDYDLLLKISKDYEAIGIDKYLTYYRMHDNNITSTKIYDNNIEVVKLLEEYIKNNNLSFNIKYNILLNNSYRLGSLTIKLLLKRKFRNIFEIVRDYFLYLLLFPFSIIKFKIIK